MVEIRERFLSLRTLWIETQWPQSPWPWATLQQDWSARGPEAAVASLSVCHGYGAALVGAR